MFLEIQDAAGLVLDAGDAAASQGLFLSKYQLVPPSRGDV